MPELPEVEVVKRSLLSLANRATIIGAKIINRNLRYKVNKKISSELLNQKIKKIERKSKYLIFFFNNKMLLVHLGMTGKFLFIRNKDNKKFKTSFYYDLNISEKHNHIYFVLNNGFTLVYNDVRRFGYFKFYNHTRIKNIEFLANLGPEPFSKSFNLKYFKNYTINKKKNIKNLLMDQHFVSGLGNIYVNEILFMSKISPIRFCNNLSPQEIDILIKFTKQILKNSIKLGGSSIKDFKDILGKNGTFQKSFKVYGRVNEPCVRTFCKGKIKKLTISSRSSFYCDKCQR